MRWRATEFGLMIEPIGFIAHQQNGSKTLTHSIERREAVGLTTWGGGLV
jgi:hypothetical protein